MAATSSTSSSDGTSAAPLLRRLPWAAILAALVVLAVETFVAARPDLFADGLFRTATSKATRLADTARADDVLVLGNSRAFSIRPEVVGAALGGGVTVANQTWALAGAESYERVLDVVLRRAHPPRLILVDPFPELVAVPPAKLDPDEVTVLRTRLYAAVPAPVLLAQFARRGEWGRFGDLLTHLALPPTVKHRAPVQAALLGLARGRWVAGPSALDRQQVADLAAHGAYRMHEDAVVNRAVFAQAERLVAPLGVYRDSPALAAYGRFLARAAAAGIAVRMLGVPMPELAYDRYEEVGALAAYREILARWQQDYPTFGLVEPVLVRWPNECFGDSTHLNRTGDERFQAFVRETLERADLRLLLERP